MENLPLMFISLTSILSLIIGIVFGIIIIFLIYMLNVIKAINEEETALTNEDENQILISEKLNQELSLFKKNKNSTIAECISDLIKRNEEMTNFVTKTLYPLSENPKLEITVKEAIELSRHISKRVDDLLEKKPLRILKKLKITQIIKITLIKKTIDNNFIMRFNKKLKISQKFGIIKGILNFINPVYWIRKILMNTIIIFMVRKICLKVISVVTIETYNVYSKDFMKERV